MNVIPETSEQIQAAVTTLCRRALWRYDRHGRELIMLLTPWYRAEWTNSAILHALDRDPAGEWRSPWTSQAGDLVEFIAKRLRIWRTGATEATAPNQPPVAGVPAHQWLARMREREEQEWRPRRTPQAELAAATPARAPRPLPLAKLRTRQDRRDNAMASLEKYLPATTASSSTTAQPSDGYHDSRLELTNLPLLADPAVLRALVLVAAQPQPARHLRTRLRIAVRNARTQAALDRLNTGTTGDTTPTATDLATLLEQVLGPDGEQLRYDDVVRWLGDM
jgi:hypothetical protein